jgi:ferritin-like metal-binding protein YciE
MAKQSKKLEELFHDTLKDIYYAEKKILNALPKMAKAAQSEDLRAAFEKHHGETEEQVTRLEQVFEEIEEKPQGKKCPAIDGMIEEGQEVIKEYKGSPALDATRSRATAPCALGPRRWVSIRRPSCSTRLWRRKRQPT